MSRRRGSVERALHVDQSQAAFCSRSPAGRSHGDGRDAHGRCSHAATAAYGANWQMNETTGPMTDSSGNGNNSSSVEIGVTRDGSVYHFARGRVMVPSHPSTTPGSRDFTLTARIHLKSTSGGENWVQKNTYSLHGQQIKIETAASICTAGSRGHWAWPVRPVQQGPSAAERLPHRVLHQDRHRGATAARRSTPAPAADRRRQREHDRTLVLRRQGPVPSPEQAGAGRLRLPAGLDGLGDAHLSVTGSPTRKREQRLVGLRSLHLGGQGTLDSAGAPAIPVLNAAGTDVIGWRTHQQVLRAIRRTTGPPATVRTRQPHAVQSGRTQPP